jgi:group I intron endonuclease
MAEKSKKELKEAYKQMKLPIGVYQIRNIENGKLFVDSSLNLKAAWNSNKFQLEMGSHHNKALQEDWNSFGPTKFAFEILEEIEQDENPTADFRNIVKTLESIYIEELKPYGDKGYNFLKN